MLRLILLASLSLVSGCSCDALWGAYEVPCTRGFDCPDAAMPGEPDMAMPSGDEDLRDPGDLRGADLRSTDMSGGDMGSGFDLNMTGGDMIVIVGGRDVDIVK